MKHYFDFERIEQRVQKEYDRKMRYIKYWKKIERCFEKKAQKNIDTFEKAFKHDYHSDIVFDSEMTIEGIAKTYGYEIVDERLTGKESVYVFKKAKK